MARWYDPKPRPFDAAMFFADWADLQADKIRRQAIKDSYAPRGDYALEETSRHYGETRKVFGPDWRVKK